MEKIHRSEDIKISLPSEPEIALDVLNNMLQLQGYKISRISSPIPQAKSKGRVLRFDDFFKSGK